MSPQRNQKIISFNVNENNTSNYACFSLRYRNNKRSNSPTYFETNKLIVTKYLPTKRREVYGFRRFR